MSRTVITRGATALLLAFGLSACASSNSSSTSQVSFPVPEAPGIYAYTTKDDLRRIDGDPTWEASTWSERANLPSNILFVVNEPALASRSAVGAIELWRVAWVRSEVNASNQAVPLAATEWAVAAVAPYSVPVRFEWLVKNSSVVKVVPTAPLTPGLYALRVNEPGARQARVGVGWASLDQRQYAAINCVDRYLAEGGIYRPCTAVVVAQSLTVAPAGTVIHNPGVSAPAVTPLAVPATPVVTPAPVTTMPATQPVPAVGDYKGLNIVLGQPIRHNNNLVLQGTVTNDSNTVQTIPAMQATLHDAAGRDVQRWIFHPTVSTLAPGARMAFQTEIRPASTNIATATVAFTR